MTQSEKDHLLDLLWKAMSAAADHKDIPMKAQLIAGEFEADLDRFTRQMPEDN